MKKVILSTGIILSIVFIFACGSGKTNDNTGNGSENTEEVQIAEASFKVSGNCGMCEDRIEKAANKVKGVESAEWDKDSKILKLTHDKGLDVNDVHKAVALVGHDTESHKAEDDVYEGLPDCCHYER